MVHFILQTFTMIFKHKFTKFPQINHKNKILFTQSDNWLRILFYLGLIVDYCFLSQKDQLALRWCNKFTRDLFLPNGDFLRSVCLFGFGLFPFQELQIWRWEIFKLLKKL